MTAGQAARRMTSIGVVGSGNVFADLGLPDPETRLAKAHVVIEIADVMEDRGIGHGKAARLIGISRSELMELLRGRAKAYTLDSLKECLRRLSA
jgi:predicted XRE-type DNA-binding protein